MDIQTIKAYLYVYLTTSTGPLLCVFPMKTEQVTSLCYISLQKVMTISSERDMLLVYGFPSSSTHTISNIKTEGRIFQRRLKRPKQHVGFFSLSLLPGVMFMSHVISLSVPRGHTGQY